MYAEPDECVSFRDPYISINCRLDFSKYFFALVFFMLHIIKVKTGMASDLNSIAAF